MITLFNLFNAYYFIVNILVKFIYFFKCYDDYYKYVNFIVVLLLLHNFKSNYRNIN